MIVQMISISWQLLIPQLGYLHSMSPAPAPRAAGASSAVHLDRLPIFARETPICRLDWPCEALHSHISCPTKGERPASPSQWVFLRGSVGGGV